MSSLKILILKPSSLGDIVLALPVLRLLKKHLPESEIFWWIESGFASLLEQDPDLTGLILFDRRAWSSPRNWTQPIRSVQSVRKQQFDWVIDLQALARSAAFGWFARGELFIGLDDAREWARGFYDIIVPRPRLSLHAADWYLEVLKHLGIPRHSDFCWLPPRPAVASRIAEKWASAGKKWIILQPGARWPNKRWPAEYFAELVRLLTARYPGFHFAILGGKADQTLGRVITAAHPERCVDLTGQTTLPEMVEWIRICELFVTNDTGPMHVASALNKPLVALLGPTHPLRTGPYHRPQDVLQLDLPCVPCMKSTCSYVREMECLRALSPGRVLTFVEERLDGLR